MKIGTKKQLNLFLTLAIVAVCMGSVVHRLVYIKKHYLKSVSLHEKNNR